MALTLAQYKAFMTTGLSPQILDAIQRNSWLIDNIPWTDNGVAMNGKWIYSYSRRTVKRGADTRLVNEEYVPEEVVAPVAVQNELSIIGGSFTIDRVMRNAGGVANLVEEEFGALVLATTEKFTDLVINGDASNPGEFDGLDQILAGTTTEYNATSYLDVSDAANIATNFKAFRLLMNRFKALLGRKPDALLVDEDFMPLFNEIAQTAALQGTTADNFGAMVATYDGIPIVSVGNKPGGTTKIIGTQTRTISGTPRTNLTDIYAVNFGPREFHAVSPNSRADLIHAYEPDFERPGVVHLGEAEMLATIALESTTAAAVLRNIKIA